MQDYVARMMLKLFSVSSKTVVPAQAGTQVCLHQNTGACTLSSIAT